MAHQETETRNAEPAQSIASPPLSPILEEAKPSPQSVDNPQQICRHRTLVLVFIMFAYFLNAFDNTVVANLRPRLVEDLNGVDRLPLLSIAFNLSTSCVYLLWGRLYQHFNMRYIFCAGVLIFQIGNVVCGSARDMDILIGGRIISGLGGSGLYFGSIQLVTQMTTPAERPKFLGILGVFYALGLLLGPIVGGAFAVSSATWRWAFYILLPLGAITAPVYLFMIPQIRLNKTESFTARLRRIDFLGFVLWIPLIAGFNLFPTLGGSLYTWSDSRVIGLGVCFGLGVLLFGTQQHFTFLTNSEDRFFPASPFFSKDSTTIIVLFLQMMGALCSMYTPLYFIPVQLQFVGNDSALLAGAKLLPYIGTLALSLIASSLTFTRIPIYMPFYLFGSTLILIGGVCLHFADLARSDSYLIGVSVLVSLGAGAYGQTSIAVAQRKVARAGQPELLPAATQLMGVAQVLGINTALVSANSIFINLAASGIGDVLPGVQRKTAVNAVSGAGSAVFGKLSPALRIAVLERIVSALQRVYYLVIVVAVLAMFLATFMKRERLEEERKEVVESSEEDVANTV